MAPDLPWGVVNMGSAVIGVYSQADGMPFRQTGFKAVQIGFDAAQRYADWRFVASVPPVTTTLPNAGTAPGRPQVPTPSTPGGAVTPAPASPLRGVR
jgi:hypothetical protein